MRGRRAKKATDNGMKKKTVRVATCIHHFTLLHFTFTEDPFSQKHDLLIPEYKFKLEVLPTSYLTSNLFFNDLGMAMFLTVKSLLKLNLNNCNYSSYTKVNLNLTNG